jgi:uncharacterized protein YndB with AHSA1/START domain
MPTTSVSRIIPAPVHDIWAVLSDIPSALRWNPSWDKIEFSSNQTHGAGTRFRAHVDDQWFEFEISDWIVPEFISFTPIRGEQEERYAITLELQAFRLTPLDDDATQVEIISHASTSGVRGFLVGLLFWAGHQKQGLAHALDNVESLVEPAPADEAAQEADEAVPDPKAEAE